MLDHEAIAIFFRLLLVLIAPITGVVLAVSVASQLLLSFVKVNDVVMLYVVRFVVVAVGLMILYTSATQFFVDEVRRLLLL